MAKRLQATGSATPRIHYVAPMVWAWRPGRVRVLARLLDHLFCLLPNAPAYFHAAGLGATHVGHAVVAYRVSVTAAIARRLLRIRYVSLVNLLLDRPAVPELLQERCRPELLAEAVSALLGDAATREAQRAAGREAPQRLGQGGPPPSARAARIVLDVIGSRAKPG